MSGTGKRNSVQRYSWFSLDINSAWTMTWLFTLVVIALCIAFFVFYCFFSNDLAPDSLAGYTVAIVGTLFILLAALAYTRSRRSRNRSVGRLNISLYWHISFGLVALALLFLHSFGNFNPRTGTYALYGMIALMISGTIGRILGRVVPKLIAHDVRIVLIIRNSHPSAIRQVLQREEYYRTLLSFWRICHIVLAFITLGLTLWHLEYAATLLLPTFFKSIPS